MAWITFSYDDGLKSNYDIALPLHDRFNIPASLAVISERVINPSFWGGFMSSSEVVDADRRGHEVVSHGVYHKEKFTEMSDGKLNYELSHSQDVLSKLLGKVVSAINIPFVAYDERVMACARKYYKQIRLAGERYNNIEEDTDVLYAYSINSKTGIETLKKIIDEAVRNNKWLILILHDIEDFYCPKGVYANTKDFLEEALSYTSKYINEMRLTPVLFRDVLELKKIKVQYLLMKEKGIVLAKDAGYSIIYYPASIKSDKIFIGFESLTSESDESGVFERVRRDLSCDFIAFIKYTTPKYRNPSLKDFKRIIRSVCADKEIYISSIGKEAFRALYYSEAIGANTILDSPVFGRNSLVFMIFFKIKQSFLRSRASSLVLTYDPGNSERLGFFEKRLLSLYSNSRVIEFPYSGKTVFKTLNEHGRLIILLEVLLNQERGEVIYDTESCYVWNYEKGRSLVDCGLGSEALKYLKKSIELNETDEAKILLTKIRESNR